MNKSPNTSQNNLKQKTLYGLLWSAIERFSVQIIQFLVQIVVARLLVPSDYGMIGMLAIFLALAQTFTDGGFGNALIQKKDRTQTDYYTVFWFNLCVGICLAIAFFLSAGAIARFYRLPTLEIVIQIMSINLIILALQIVHKTILTINIDFKTQAKSSLFSVLVAGIVSIVMAYKGCGVWALVAQSIIINFLQTALFWYWVKWRPKLVFSKASFKKLFSFGSKILGANLIHTIYLNLYTLVIGKKFSSHTLGLYTRADQFAQFPSSNITGILWRVTYPIMSSIQDDNQRLTNIYRSYVRLSAFIIFPLMMGLAALAEPFIVFILTKKWIGVVPILQIICFSYMFYPINAIAQNLMQVKGRSDLFLRLEIVKKIIGVALLFAILPWGMNWVCYSLIVYALINLAINTYYTARLIPFGIAKQLCDIFKIFMLALVMGACVYAVNFLPCGNLLKLILGSVAGMIIYILFAWLLRMQEFTQLIQLLKQKGLSLPFAKRSK